MSKTWTYTEVRWYCVMVAEGAIDGAPSHTYHHTDEARVKKQFNAYKDTVNNVENGYAGMWLYRFEMTWGAKPESLVTLVDEYWPVRKPMRVYNRPSPADPQASEVAAAVKEVVLDDIPPEPDMYYKEYMFESLEELTDFYINQPTPMVIAGPCMTFSKFQDLKKQLIDDPTTPVFYEQLEPFSEEVISTDEPQF